MKQGNYIYIQLSHKKPKFSLLSVKVSLLTIR